MRISTLAGWLCFAMFTMAPIAGAAEETPASLLAKAQTIKSYRCKGTDASGAVTAEYAMRIPDCLLMRIKGPNGHLDSFMINDVVTFGGELTVIMEGGQKAVSADLRKVSAGVKPDLAIEMIAGMFESPYLNFLQLDPAKAKIVEQQEVDGQKLYVIEASRYKTLGMWTNDEPKGTIRFTVGADGFPRKVSEVRENGVTDEIVLSEVEVNTAIPDSVFTPPADFKADDKTLEMTEAAKNAPQGNAIPPALKALFGPGLTAK